MGQQGHLYEPRDGELIGIKQMNFGNLKEINLYLRSVKEASAYSKIPTLLRILTFEASTNRTSSNVGGFSGLPHRIGCGENLSVNIFFPYCQQSLAHVL